jgi:cytolysin (calcineurin-like family phosphatase)
MEAPSTFTLDGIAYDVSQFSPGVQQAISIYHRINMDLVNERMAVLKSESALQLIGKQIADAANRELEEKKAKATAPEQAPEA